MRTDGQTGRYDEASSRFSQNFEKRLKNVSSKKIGMGRCGMPRPGSGYAKKKLAGCCEKQ